MKERKKTKIPTPNRVLVYDVTYRPFNIKNNKLHKAKKSTESDT